MTAPGRRRESGVVLLLVLFFALLLTGGIATFTARATVDSMISRNREAAARAEALARGGVRLATALLLEDAAAGAAAGDASALDSQLDVWARLQDIPITAEDGSTLRIRVEDSGTRLNLNAVVALDAEGNLAAPVEAEGLLHVLLETVIDDIDAPAEDKYYDVPELVDNLIDFVDQDDVRLNGGLEADVYLDRTPAFTPPNRPLLSLDELRLVAGFDEQLVAALRPYVTVYPYVGGGGINPNTAPPHVLSLIFYNDGVSLRLATDDVVRQILDARDKGDVICGDKAKFDGCLPIREIVTNAIYPAPTFQSNVFTVTAEARVASIRRTVEAVIDRSQAEAPLLLSWRVR